MKKSQLKLLFKEIIREELKETSLNEKLGDELRRKDWRGTLVNMLLALSINYKEEVIGYLTSELNDNVLKKVYNILRPKGKTDSHLKKEAKVRGIKRARARANIESSVSKIPTIKTELDSVTKKIADLKQISHYFDIIYDRKG